MRNRNTWSEVQYERWNHFQLSLILSSAPPSGALWRMCQWFLLLKQAYVAMSKGELTGGVNCCV